MCVLVLLCLKDTFIGALHPSGALTIFLLLLPQNSLSCEETIDEGIPFSTEFKAFHCTLHSVGLCLSFRARGSFSEDG